MKPLKRIVIRDIPAKIFKILKEIVNPSGIYRVVKILMDKLLYDTQPQVLWTEENLFTVQATRNNQKD